jgi:RimJ/RimL family protein N-acetyltransferase
MKHDSDGRNSEAPVISVSGALVALGPPRRELLATYLRWRNDFDVMRQLGDVEPLTLAQEIARYEALAGDADTIRFTIYELPGMRPIGSTSFNDIDWAGRAAQFSILIGEADARGKGYGTEATRLMLDYAFTALGLHSVWLRVFAFNPAARRAYEKAGFREFARRGAAQHMGGTYWDVIYMDCLATDFDSPVLKDVFKPDEPVSRRASR